MPVMIDLVARLTEKVREGREAPEYHYLLSLTEEYSVRLFMVLDKEDHTSPLIERAVQAKRLLSNDQAYWEKHLPELAEGPISNSVARSLLRFGDQYIGFKLTGPYALQADAGIQLSVGARKGISSPIVFTGSIVRLETVQQYEPIPLDPQWDNQFHDD